MRYILDTDTCIWLLRERQPLVARVSNLSPDDVAVAAMTEAELRYGARKSHDAARAMRQVEAFLAAPIDSLPFDSDAARWHAELRYELRANPIGERDLVIASIAAANGCVVITGNMAEFARVPGLVCENWSTPG